MSAVLTDIKTNEVSLVTRGANRKRFALRKDETKKNENTEVAKPLDGLSDAAKQAVTRALELLRGVREELPSGMLEAMATALGYGAETKAGPDMPGYEYPPEPNHEDTMTTPTKPADDVKKDDITAKPELSPAAKEQLAKAEATAKAAVAEAAELRKSLEESSKKNADSADLRKSLDESNKKAVELEKQIKAERDERMNREFVAKAAVLKHLPSKPEELGPVLKSLFDAAPEAAAKLEKMLEAANAKLAKVEELTKELGRGGAENGEQSAWGQIKKAAAELRKANAALTEPAAISKAMELNPGLYEEYNREQAERS